MTSDEKKHLQEFAQWLLYTKQASTWEAENICDILERIQSRTGSKFIIKSRAFGYTRYCAAKLVKNDVFSLFPGEYDEVCHALEAFVAYADRKCGNELKRAWSVQDCLFSEPEQPDPKEAPEHRTEDSVSFAENIRLSCRIMEAITSCMEQAADAGTADVEQILERLQKQIEPVLAQRVGGQAYSNRDSSVDIQFFPAQAAQFRKLQKKIIQAFTEQNEARKIHFIGDVQIDDDEYALLLEYTRHQLKSHAVYSPGIGDSPLMAVALVQIGIRFYDGSYWPHAERELRVKLPGTSQKFLNETFQNTARVYEFHLMQNTHAVQSILFHGIVSNYYAKGLFELLFQYYNRDLRRNINKSTPERMAMFLEAIKQTEKENDALASDFVSKLISGTSKAYKLNKHTLAAITAFPQTNIPRLMKYIELIDGAFWNHKFPTGTGTRLTECFKSWAENSCELQENYRVRCTDQKNAVKRKKYFQSPYLRIDRKENCFELRLPQQVLRPDLAGDSVVWEIRSGDTYNLRVCDAYEVFGGIETAEESFPISQKALLAAIECVLRRGETIINRFTIPAVCARFFDEDGDQASSLQAGIYSGFTYPNQSLRSSALLDDEMLQDLHRWDFDFTEGDVILLPDGNSQCIGGNFHEGLLQRGRISCAVCEKIVSAPVPIYNTAPELLLSIDEEKLDGTALYVNSRRYRLSDCQFDKIETAQLNGKSVILLSAAQFPEIANNTVNHITVELPGSAFARAPFAFALCLGLKIEFEDAPYIFAENGTIVFPASIAVDCAEGQSCPKSPVGNSFNFDLTEQDGQLHFVLSENRLPIAVDIPAFSWRSKQTNWTLAPMGDIWNSEFPYMLYIRGPFKEVRFDFGIDADAIGNGEAFSSLVFRKNAADGVFYCDLTRMRSWITRDKICYPLKILLDKNAFPLGVIYTKSILMPDKLELVADFEKEQLVLNCEIIGRRKEYYADIRLKKSNRLIAEKSPFDGQQLVLACEIPNGEYEVTIYENDDEDFFDDTYYALGSYSCTLINKNNLSDKQIRLQYVNRQLYGKFRFPIKGDMRVRNLKRLAAQTYQAELTAGPEEEDALYQVKLTLSDAEDKLGRFFLHYWDEKYEEYYEFDYDRTMHILLTEQEEQRNLPYNQRYRRYTTLFEDQDTFVGVFEDKL